MGIKALMIILVRPRPIYAQLLDDRLLLVVAVTHILCIDEYIGLSVQLPMIVLDNLFLFQLFFI